GGQDLEIQVAQDSCDRNRPGPAHPSLVDLAERYVGAHQVGADLPTPAVVVQLVGKGLGLAQPLQDLPNLTQVPQQWSQLDPDFESVPHGGWACRQGLDDTQRLLKPRPRVLGRGPCGRPLSSLAEIGHSLLAQVAAHGVISELLNIPAETILLD